MTIVRVGSNKAYADGWGSAFGGKKTKQTKVKPKATKKKTKKKK